ncbi:winged helix-turn-helix transcriptional regulator [Streptomyces sp900116325]|uniref:LexA family protein n=1 Tax=Streptomyces sp. 900116325 TaxID=3154295 RepID=UPI0033BBC49E
MTPTTARTAPGDLVAALRLPVWALTDRADTIRRALPARPGSRLGRFEWWRSLSPEQARTAILLDHLDALRGHLAGQPASRLRPRTIRCRAPLSMPLTASLTRNGLADRRVPSRGWEAGHVMRELTARQERILAFIRTAIADSGEAPTVREIAEGVGLSSPSSVAYHLGRLEEGGYIQHEPGRHRSIRLL